MATLYTERRVYHQESGRRRRRSWLLPIAKEALRALSILESIIP
jgi:hypothetical protein